MTNYKKLVLNIPITCYVYNSGENFVGFVGLCQSFTQAKTIEELEENLKELINMQQDYYNRNIGDKDESN